MAMLPHEYLPPPVQVDDVTSRAAGVSNVLLAATANEKLDRIIALLEQIAGQRTAPPPSPDNARAFLDGLRGMSVEEMRAANRDRNRRLKAEARRRT